MAKQTNIINLEENKPDNVGRPAIDDIKSILYLINAKPDSQIRLLKGKRIIGLGDIRNINERVFEKISNNYVENFITSVNISIGKVDIKSYGVWAEFLREDWSTINEKTQSVTITWDFYVKFPNYELPQRHTMKFRVGKEIAPKDMFHLMFTSDNPSEFKELTSDATCKVDFVNQILATEFMNLIDNWYEGLTEVPKEKGIQGLFVNNQRLVIGAINNFVPILLLFPFVLYANALYEKWNIDKIITLSYLNWFLFAFAMAHVTGFTLSRVLSIWMDGKIDKYKEYSQFIITKGDENAKRIIKEDNWKITSDILWKIALTLLGVIITILVKPTIEKWL